MTFCDTRFRKLPVSKGVEGEIKDFKDRLIGIKLDKM